MDGTQADDARLRPDIAVNSLQEGATVPSFSVTPGLPELPEPGAGMHAIERRFRVLRRLTPDLPKALRLAYEHVGGSLANGDPHLRRLYDAGLSIAAAVDAEAIQTIAAGRPELPYHNRHHFVEATLAMGWLCAVARARGAISLHEAVVGVVAMVGHDFRHDGTWNQTGALEKVAADAVISIATCAGVNGEDCQALRGIILATALPAVRANKARAAEQERAGCRQGGMDAMHLMASEADVLTSLMPGLGCRLGHALAAEWSANPGSPPLDPASFTGRVAFLRLHDYFSEAATELGLLRMHDSQLMAFRQISERSGGVAWPEVGAALLDRLKPCQAVRAFGAALRQTGSDKHPHPGSGPPSIRQGTFDPWIPWSD